MKGRFPLMPAVYRKKGYREGEVPEDNVTVLWIPNDVKRSLWVTSFFSALLL